MLDTVLYWLMPALLTFALLASAKGEEAEIRSEPPDQQRASEMVMGAGILVGLLVIWGGFGGVAVYRAFL